MASSQPDVLVIGAGVIGAAVAWELAVAGANVRVLEMRGPGLGATQASAGMLAPYIEGHGSAALSDLGRRSLEAYDSFIERVSADAGQHPLYNRRGTLEVARDEGHAASLLASAAALSGRVETEWCEGARLAAVEPLLGAGVIGALLVPSHGFVAAGDLANVLVAAARSRGAVVESAGRARRISDAGGGRLKVETDTGTFTADRVVLAAGSWSGQIAIDGAPALPMRPVRGQLLHLALRTQSLHRIVWGADCYLVPWPEGDVLVGATVEDAGFDERATVAGVSMLLDAATILVPTLKDATFSGARVGLRPAGPDDLPVVGASAVLPGLVYATAHYRNGVLLAPLTAQLVRGIIMGEPADPALAHLSPARAGAL